MIDGNVCLNIRLMGTPEISSGGLPLALNQLKSRGLLFYLAATGQPHTRAHLTTFLWGESGHDEAHHSLEKGSHAKSH
jgi:DNA-binding SARP family transcriptional activator